MDPEYVDEVVVKNTSKIAVVQMNLPLSVMDKPGEVKIKQIVASEDRCLMLCGEQGEVVVWGGNEKGQLGLGHYTDVYTP
jgi:alpha-tubulin suppressor-like RCC1 family protein